jgi:AcrR family transcriptional regulator
VSERTLRPDRRTEILTKAAELFARSGFHGVSIDDLGSAVGLTGPALYRYFPGKEAILSAMLIDISERLLAGGEQRAAAHAAPRSALSALVDFHVDFALDNTDLINVQMRDLAAMPESEQRIVRRLQAKYVSLWTDALMEIRPIDRDEARAAAQATFGLINSTPHSAWLSRPDMARLLQGMALAALAITPTPE